MGKEWPCDKCGMILKWKEPYVQGTKPINKEGEMPHDCKGAPPPETPKVSSPASEEAPKVPKHLGTNPAGADLENSYVNNRRALSLQVWHLAIHDAKVLVGGNTDKQLEVAQTLYLGMMSNL